MENAKTNQNAAKSIKKRASILDIAKSLALINMLCYHAMYDIVYIFGVDAPWFKGAGAHIWQQAICFTFIICSGAVLGYSKNAYKHAAVLFICGLILTLVTYFFMPAEVIYFGVLSLLGTAAFITALLMPLLNKIPAAIGAVASLIIFILTYDVPNRGYPFRFFYWLGFPREGFWSSDYFPLIPWLFLYICGYFIWRFIMQSKLKDAVLSVPRIKICEAVSRASLIIYMLHQPIIYGALLLIFS